MLELIGSIVLIYIVFRILDSLFPRNPYRHRRFVVKDVNGDRYLVEEREAPPPVSTEERPNLRLVK